MTSLLLTSNRSYFKFPIFILYRHLSTIEHRPNDQLLFANGQTNLVQNSMQKTEWNFLRYPLSQQQRRSITLHVPPTDDEKQTSKKNQPLSFEFPPGNPNDKPKLEHLRYIESQLIRILPDFCRRMHPYALYTADIIFENYYVDPPKIMKGAGSYALSLFWIRTKLNFKLMNVTIHLLKTTIDEESDCVKVRWRISGLSNKSFVGVIKGWRKPKDVVGNIRDYMEYIDGLSTFYVRGDGRIYKHRVDRMMVDEDKEVARSPLDKKKIAATAPVSV